MNTYNKTKVKRMLLQYHNLDGTEKLTGIEGVRKIMMRLGSVQYDPLNVVGRNADLVLQARAKSRWGHKKLSSAALDFFYNKGELCVAQKRGTQKYFDLTERIIPSDLDQMDEMSIDDFLDWYVTRRIQSLGFVWDKNGGAWQGHFLSDKELRKKVLDRLAEKHAISTFQINGIPNTFYACNEMITGSSGRSLRIMHDL